MKQPKKFERDHLYRTANGCLVRIICVDRKGFSFPIIGLVRLGFRDDGVEQEIVEEYDLQGKAYTAYPGIGLSEDIVEEVDSDAHRD